MFSFFSKKPAIAPENVPLPESPPPHPRVIHEPEPSKVASGSHVQLQLRTPSPSIASGSVVHGVHPSPAPTASTSSNRVASPIRPTDVVREDDAPTILTRDSLVSLILSVPAKTMHAYTLSHIPDASEDTVRNLASFFNALTPPPKLHCVRCHKDYVEVDNDDRSCLVPHDDESAEVERVGRGSGPEARRTTGGTEYETLWGCCGKTTEGNGDQGPPDGFCYEGRHTTDVKRARFRADSTPQQDRLVSCLRLNCHGIRDTLPRTSARKRPRSRFNYEEASAHEDGSEGEADSGMEEIATEALSKAKPKSSNAQSKGKGKPTEADEDKMDVDEAGEGGPDSASRLGSIRGKRKPKSRAAATPGTPSSVPKRRGRPPKSKSVPKDSDVESVAVSVKSVPAPTTKRRGRQPKSKMYVSDSEDERGRSVRPRGSGSKLLSASVSPSRVPLQHTLPPRTRSQSRSRVQTIVSRLEAATTVASPSSSNAITTPKTSTKLKAGAAEQEDNEEDDAQPKKKRKVAS